MSDFAEARALAASGLKAQAMRLRHVSENIANVDTPGYHRKMTPFHAELRTGDSIGKVEVGEVFLDRSALERIHDPSHPLADESGYFEGSNVSLLIEIADAREAQRSYEANLKMFDQARTMSQGLLDLLRR